MRLLNAIIGSSHAFFILYHYYTDYSIVSKWKDTNIAASFNTYFIIATSVFLYLMPFELYFSPIPTRDRILLSIHHILSIIAVNIAYDASGIVAVDVAIALTMELSNVFIIIRKIGKILNNKRMRSVGGIGVLITYPITRLVFGPYGVYFALTQAMEKYISNFYSAAGIFLCSSSLFYWIHIMQSLQHRR